MYVDIQYSSAAALYFLLRIPWKYMEFFLPFRGKKSAII